MAIIAKARDMRRRMTPPEARLWIALRPLRREGYHFRRQAPLRGYYLDFVCFRCRLIVEVDGATHLARARHDAVRDAVFAREGFRTLRFLNAEVRDDLDRVIREIRAALEAAVPTRPALRASRPPHEGEGDS